MFSAVEEIMAIFCDGLYSVVKDIDIGGILEVAIVE